MTYLYDLKDVYDNITPVEPFAFKASDKFERTFVQSQPFPMTDGATHFEILPGRSSSLAPPSYTKTTIS